MDQISVEPLSEETARRYFIDLLDGEQRRMEGGDVKEGRSEEAFGRTGRGNEGGRFCKGESKWDGAGDGCNGVTGGCQGWRREGCLENSLPLFPSIALAPLCAPLELFDRPQVKLADFGTGQVLPEGEDTISFSPGFSPALFSCPFSELLAGTPAFLSPEACRKGQYSGRAADIWAAGVGEGGG
eukprot:768681-Hanusia_phi.AAC.4